jgi:predicted nucleic acid-binding protein
MTEVRDIRTYSFRTSDRLFIDANVWLLIHGPTPTWRNSIRYYTNAYKTWLEKKCQVFLDLVVLSEFVNAYARMEYKHYVRGGDDFKSYRKSPSFADVAKEIAEKSRRIANQCQRCDVTFSQMDLAALFDEFASGDFDFNDQIIANTCHANELVLVTDDADFAGSDLIILTANSNLLRPGFPET